MQQVFCITAVVDDKPLAAWVLDPIRAFADRGVGMSGRSVGGCGRNSSRGSYPHPLLEAFLTQPNQVGRNK